MGGLKAVLIDSVKGLYVLMICAVVTGCRCLTTVLRLVFLVLVMRYAFGVGVGCRLGVVVLQVMVMLCRMAL